MSNQEQRGNNDYFLPDMAHEGWQERLDYLGLLDALLSADPVAP